MLRRSDGWIRSHRPKCPRGFDPDRLGWVIQQTRQLGQQIGRPIGQGQHRFGAQLDRVPPVQRRLQQYRVPLFVQRLGQRARRGDAQLAELVASLIRQDLDRPRVVRIDFPVQEQRAHAPGLSAHRFRDNRSGVRSGQDRRRCSVGLQQCRRYRAGGERELQPIRERDKLFLADPNQGHAPELFIRINQQFFQEGIRPVNLRPAQREHGAKPAARVPVADFLEGPFAKDRFRQRTNRRRTNKRIIVAQPAHQLVGVLKRIGAEQATHPFPGRIGRSTRGIVAPAQ